MLPFVLLLACSPAPAPSVAPDPLAVERSALHDAERRVFVAEAERKVAAGDFEGAAQIVALERSFWPADFAALEDRILRGDPAAAARFAAVGAPVDARVERARIGRDYAGGSRVEDRSRGATQAQARAIWSAVRSTWVDPLDDAAVSAVSAVVVRQLTWLAEDPGFGARYGALQVPDAEGDPPTVLARAIAAGWPAGVVVVEGMDAALRSLDPWTRAVWPADRSGWDAHHAGVTLGVGAALDDAPDGRVVVVLPQVGGPAWLGGVHAGDEVVAVNGAEVSALPAPRSAAVAALLEGPPGSRISLGLRRGAEARVVELGRAEVPEETALGWRRTDDGWDVFAAEGVAWVRLSAFRPTTDEAFDALTEYAEPSVVVLDLRGNGGGDLAAALHVADRFVVDGPMVVLEGPTHPPPQPGPNGELPWNAAAPGHALEGTPVVVLVDGRTASAAEILAAILRERAGAVILGEPTFGKLRSQSLRDDPATGAAWQVTTGRWRVGSVAERVEVDWALPVSAAERRAVDELVARRELPATHPDGTPVPWLGSVRRSDLPELSRDPLAERALRLASTFVR